MFSCFLLDFFDFFDILVAVFDEGLKADLVIRTASVGMAKVRYDGWVSSRDEIQARLFLDDCKHFANILHTAVHDLGVQVIEEEKTYVLEFASGVKINSMSSSPDAQAGKRGDRLLDEFALHKDPRKLYAIAYPGITWGGQLEDRKSVV